MFDIKVIKIDGLHKSILDYIETNKIIISEYEDMKECILKMIRSKYVFNMNRDRLRDAMEDITYMISPNDEINKDRVEKGLEYEYSDDELADSDDEECYDEEVASDKDSDNEITPEECDEGLTPRPVTTQEVETEPEAEAEVKEEAEAEVKEEAEAEPEESKRITIEEIEDKE